MIFCLLRHGFVDYLETGYANPRRAEKKNLDAYFDQRKNVLGVSKTVGRSSRDVVEMMTMHQQVLQLPQMECMEISTAIIKNM
jgi:hypothetical protein